MKPRVNVAMIACFVGGIAIVVVLLVYNTDLRCGAGVLALGVKHGTEDARSRIAYADDAPLWEIFRNGATWTHADIQLVREFVALPQAALMFSLRLFEVGYFLGYHLAMTVAVVSVSCLAWAIRRKRRQSVAKRAKATTTS